MTDTIDWYDRNHPKADLTADQHRCLEVLAEWERLYNLPITSRTRLDGGFRPCGAGIEIHCRTGTILSTFDTSGLTRLVLAAHRHACRVEVSAGGYNRLVIRVHPRITRAEQPDANQFAYHPTLDDLADRCHQPAPEVLP